MKTDSRKFLAVFFIAPYLVLLLSSLGYLIDLRFLLETPKFIIFLILQLLFMFALSHVLSNALIETSLFFYEDKKNSSLFKSLYDEKPFLPVKPIVFVVLFIAFYLYLSVYPQNMGVLKSAAMLIPTVAIFINAKFFVSGRIRLIDGKYMCFRKKFYQMMSYYENNDGKIIFITVEGEEFDPEIKAGDKIAALSEEFEKNGLKSK